MEVVSVEDANHMSLFYACPTPMLKTISDSTAKFVEKVSMQTNCLKTGVGICKEDIQYSYTPVRHTHKCTREGMSTLSQPGAVKLVL